jgi:uncharacterized membrane protein YkoI
MKKFTVLVFAAFLIFLTSGLSQAEVINEGSGEAAQNQITEIQAKEIALKEVPGTVHKIELETENGVQKYEVYIKAPDAMYEVEIDAKTGKVLKKEKENENNND